MPLRMVREGINSSPRINSLSRGAELFYRRLMSVADDYGRFHGSPATLRGACWPTCPEHVTEQEISDWLEETYHVHSKCLADDKQHRPLVIPYESDGAKYIQLTGFKQQTRSSSKFPEPANHLLSNCETNDQPRRRRETETETSFGDGDGDEDVKADSPPTTSRPADGSSPSWMLDETYVAFAEMANQFWPRILHEELANGHRWYWTKLSLEEKITATRNLRARLAAGEDGEYVKHMPDYLKTEWKRGPKLVAVNKLGPTSDKQQQRRHETNEGAKMLRNMR